MNAVHPFDVTVVPVTAFEQNCSIVVCRETGECAFVDPGGDLDDLLSVVEEKGAKPTKIFVTHAHLDHAGGVADLAERLSLPIEGPHVEDQFLIDTMPMQAIAFGFGKARPFTPTRFLTHGDTVRVGQVEFEVRHCPGHTPGHVVFVQHDARRLFVGDVLFQGSIGRTDFPRGDLPTLLRSIETQLLSLDDDYVFVSGHGPLSTIGRERASNPFLRRIAGRRA